MIRIAFISGVLTVLAILAPAVRSAELPDDSDWRPHVARLTAGNATAARGNDDPITAPMEVCQETACGIVSAVRLGDEEAEAIRVLFEPRPASPEQERAVIARAIARFETFVGARNGTWADQPRNLRLSWDEEGQMDCISEAANSTTYLDRLIQSGLVAYHDIRGLVIRYVVVLQHVAVEMVDRETGESWVLDSWIGANGEPAEIVPYLDWRMEFLVRGTDGSPGA